MSGARMRPAFGIALAIGIIFGLLAAVGDRRFTLGAITFLLIGGVGLLATRR